MFSDHRRSQPPGQVIADKRPVYWPSAMDPVRVPIVGRTDCSVRLALVAVGSLVVAAFVVRIWLLQTASRAATLRWTPTLHEAGRELAGDGQGWQWTLNAIRYRWHGQTYLLPPLFPCFCRFSRSFRNRTRILRHGPGRPASLSVATLFSSALVHSRRAGVVAAFVYAFWIPNIFTLAVPAGTTLHSVAVLAFALLLRATSRGPHQRHSRVRARRSEWRP